MPDLIDRTKLMKKQRYSFKTSSGSFGKYDWFMKVDDILAAPSVSEGSSFTDVEMQLIGDAMSALIDVIDYYGEAVEDAGWGPDDIPALDRIIAKTKN